MAAEEEDAVAAVEVEAAAAVEVEEEVKLNLHPPMIWMPSWMLTGIKLV